MLPAIAAATVVALAVPPPPLVKPEGDALRTAASVSFPHGVAAGDVSQDSVMLWASYSGAGMVRFEYGTDPAFHASLSTAPIQVSDPAVPVKAMVAGLTPGTQYYYRAVAADGAFAAGRFRTPAALGERRGLRFGVSGDWEGNLAPFPAVRDVAERDLDCFVALGDVIYGDVPSPVLARPARTLEEYRAKHTEVLSASHGLNTWPEARASTAFFAMIDDHEVGNDFAGGAPPLSNPRFADQKGAWINETPQYRAGLQAFGEYMPVRDEVWPQAVEPRLAGKPMLYRYRTFGSDAAFFLLDARSFRDAPVGRVMSRDIWQAGSFLFGAAMPGRTLLGRPQLAKLEEDLLAAENAGVTWKFVFMPEPIEAFGVIAADDRYEGYAAERTELLSFVHERRLRNVVFVTADFHGQIVNNIVYSWWPLTPATRPATWEIITGPVAVEPTLGAGIAELGVRSGFIPPAAKAAYDRADTAGKDRIIREFLDKQLLGQLLDPSGLQDSPIPAVLEQGEYVALHYFGWTEFEVAGPELIVTTRGIDSYTQAELRAAPQEIVARRPRVITRFRVRASS